MAHTTRIDLCNVCCSIVVCHRAMSTEFVVKRHDDASVRIRHESPMSHYTRSTTRKENILVNEWRQEEEDERNKNSNNNKIYFLSVATVSEQSKRTTKCIVLNIPMANLTQFKCGCDITETGQTVKCDINMGIVKIKRVKWATYYRGKSRGIHVDIIGIINILHITIRSHLRMKVV